MIAEAKLLGLVRAACERYADRPAFFIRGETHTYRQFSARVAAISHALLATPGPENVGVVADDDLDTYAAVFAVWFAGKTMVPVSPAHPSDRNVGVLSQAGVRRLVCSRPSSPLAKVAESGGTQLVSTPSLESSATSLPNVPVTAADVAYILFTSGSTGVPKGVPIDHGALDAFGDAFTALGFQLTCEDRFLQMFELTFDLSLMSYCVPLTLGACVFTVPDDGVKYMEVYRLLDEQRITCALKVPSVLSHLRAYFDEIELPALRVSLFCGEALPVELVTRWSVCAPGARVLNVYGPTEATIFCTAYECAPGVEWKGKNGVVAIGRPMEGVEVAIVDDQLRPVAVGEPGELCLSGAQLTPGYWKNPAKNSEAFFILDGKRYYRTGDVCQQDAGGDILYVGRVDQQVKVQGYRVELSEIEHHARAIAGTSQAAAVPYTDAAGNVAVHLFIQGPSCTAAELAVKLKERIPLYMLPARTTIVDALPLNANGKIDRPELKKRARASGEERR